MLPVAPRLPYNIRRPCLIAMQRMSDLSAVPLAEKVAAVRAWLSEQIIGQQRLIDRLLMTLLCGGHLLVEGAPGLAKTRAIKELARTVDGSFQRIQFTPDLLPSDITGSEIFHAETGTFKFQQGPIFQNLVLADEINRAPAKVQSALLEAMAEQQVTYGRRTFPLPELFMVMATQNPIEQEGTYPLPEAQLDRFLLHVEISYPDAIAERKILRLVRREAMREGGTEPGARLRQGDVFAARQQMLALHMAAPIEEYIVQLVMATRRPEHYGADLAGWIEYGVSPRGSIALDQCARAGAWLAGRAFVTPEDVQGVVHDTMRHRLLRTFAAEAAGVSVNKILDTLLSRVPAP